MSLSENILQAIFDYRVSHGKDPDIIILTESEFKELSALATGSPSKPTRLSTFTGIKVKVSEWVAKFELVETPKMDKFPIFHKDFIFDDELHKPKPIQLPYVA